MSIIHFFDKIKLILYPQFRNFMTELTIVLVLLETNRALLYRNYIAYHPIFKDSFSLLFHGIGTNLGSEITVLFWLDITVSWIVARSSTVLVKNPLEFMAPPGTPVQYKICQNTRFVRILAPFLHFFLEWFNFFLGGQKFDKWIIFGVYVSNF